jgi:hypothetical protein
MKVERRQVDFDTVELTITATGKEFDPLQPRLGGITPYNGAYTIDWGDNNTTYVTQNVDNTDPLNPVIEDDQVVVQHSYSGEGAWRIAVDGDVRIIVHALSSHAVAP